MKKNKISLLIGLLLGLNSIISAQAFVESKFNNLLRTENGGWVAGDATFSVALPDSRTLWLFGDSFIGTVNADSSLVSGAKMIRNCAIIQQGDVLNALYGGTFENPIDFIKTNNPDTTWFWPEHGIVENDTLRIFLSEFGPNNDNPDWNFKYRSTCIASFTYPELQYIDYVSLPYYNLNGVMYGDQVLVHDDYTYIYGRKEESGNIPYPHIARVFNGDLLGSWEFFSGVSWSNDAMLSRRLSNQTVSQQYGVIEHENKFIMITQEIWLGSKIYSLTANNPEGPWSNAKTLYSTPRPFPTMITYNSFPHPQFNVDNTLLISYNTNGNFWEIFNNVELYHPQFIRVPFTDIDETFSPSAINENNENNFNFTNCYPNPANDNITIQFNLENSDYVNLKIYNITASQIKSIQNKWFDKGNNQIKINLTDFPKGVYIYQIQDKRGKFVHN